MYTKFHCCANWKTMSSPTPTPAPLSGTVLLILFVALCPTPQLAMTGGFVLTMTWTTKSFWILAS